LSMRRTVDVYEGRKERREQNLSRYRPPHTFFLMGEYVAFKFFVRFLSSTHSLLKSSGRRTFFQKTLVRF